MLSINQYVEESNDAYKSFFQQKLKAAGVKTVAELPDKKSFFATVDKEWKAKGEK